MSDPKFTEMMQLRATFPDLPDSSIGFVIDTLFRDGRWLYKLSFADPDFKGATYDNWLPEEWLEKIE
jgi:hypothetical protein